MNPHLYDAQSALGFIVPQLTRIETEVYRIRYPATDYAALVPVDTTGPEWIPSTTFFSIDEVGRARWQAGNAFDIPMADINRASSTHAMHMAAIGYEYNLEEINKARLLGMNLPNDKASAARRAYSEFMYYLALFGDDEKSMTGLTNAAGVTAANLPNDGTGTSRLWADKTPALIARDINLALTGIFTDSKNVEMANTLLLPTAAYTYIASTPYSSTTMETVLSWLQRTNLYTIETGQQLMIRGIRGLEDAGDSSTGRMVAYRRDPEVLKLHLPMPHRFLPLWQNGPMHYQIPGIFRTGGVEVRLPVAMRYYDGLVA